MRNISKRELCVTQCNVINIFASSLLSIYLFHLAQRSKTTRTAIRGDEVHWRSLIKRGCCDGFGLERRVNFARAERSSYNLHHQVLAHLANIGIAK